MERGVLSLILGGRPVRKIHSFCSGVIVATAETGGIAITPRPSSDDSKPQGWLSHDPILWC